MSYEINRYADDADFIWNQIQKKNMLDMPYENLKAILTKRFPEFFKTFPIVLYKMMEGKYHRKAMKRYVNKLKKNPGKGMDGLIERMADYCKYLYYYDCKTQNLHYDSTVAKQIWQVEYENLIQVKNNIVQYHESAKEEQKKRKKEIKKENRKDLINFIIDNKLVD